MLARNDGSRERRVAAFANLRISVLNKSLVINAHVGNGTWDRLSHSEVAGCSQNLGPSGAKWGQVGLDAEEGRVYIGPQSEPKMEIPGARTSQGKDLPAQAAAAGRARREFIREYKN